MNQVAVSIHAPLLQALSRPRRGKVLSAHPQAVNLLLDGGEVLSLVGREIGNGPAAVVLPRKVPWQAGDPVRVADRSIVGPGLSASVGRAASWSPPPPPERLSPDLGQATERVAQRGSHGGLLPAALAALGHEASRPPGPAGGLFDMALRGIGLLRGGDWAGAVRCLAGLGPGLTPAGDDLLCGWACLLHRARRPEAGALSVAITSLPDSATTPLSRHFLRWAARGVAGEHHLAWADGLLRGDDRRFLDRLLAHGATSGADWAAGALLALDHLSKGE